MTRVVPLLLAACLVLACGGETTSSTSSEDDRSGGAASEDDGIGGSSSSDEARAQPPTPAGDSPLVVFLGDSLTAGLGLPEEEAFPALVEEELRSRGTPLRVVNAGVSGDTSAGGLRRLDWLLRQQPDLLVVELGVNDALRGQPVEEIERNLREIVERARAAGAGVLLLGLQIPPSYGAEYAESYAAIYPRIADDLDVPLVPFLLEGVAGNPDLNLPDGIHPTAEGHEIMAGTVTERLAPLLEDRIQKAEGRMGGTS